MTHKTTFDNCQFNAKIKAIVSAPKSADVQMDAKDTYFGNEIEKIIEVRDDVPAPVATPAPQTESTTKRSWRSRVKRTYFIPISVCVIGGVLVLLIAHLAPILQPPPNPPPVVNVIVPQEAAAKPPQVRFHFKDDTVNSAKTVISSEGIPFDVDSEHSQFDTQGNTFELKQAQK
jgi:hypothetical protein